MWKGALHSSHVLVSYLLLSLSSPTTIILISTLFQTYRKSCCRYVEVTVECCQETGRTVPHIQAADEAGGTVIASVQEPVPCSYYIIACSASACNSNGNGHKSIDPTSASSVGNPPLPTLAAEPSTGGSNGNQDNRGRKSLQIPSQERQQQLLQRVTDMFHHSYDSYMTYAYPDAELKPISCVGGAFDLAKIPLVTLIGKSKSSLRLKGLYLYIVVILSQCCVVHWKVLIFFYHILH